jgi:drug/metabolite transporter (DMT)-like permease
MRSSGTLICLTSAASFGAMGIFGKLAYDNGTTVGTLLASRFALAALVFWLVLAATGTAGQLRALSARDTLIAIGLGAIGYSLQAGLYFTALTRMDPGVLALLLYTFPAIVTVVGIAIGRERFSARRLAALVLASAGLVLVLATASTGQLDPLGSALGLCAAGVYSVYILVTDSIAQRVPPRAFSTLVCTGAAVTLALGSAAIGELRPGEVSLAGWGWLAGIALVCTVAAVTLMFAGIARVGPSVAAILSTLEPVVTVLLAFAVFGEVLGALQLVGGALVLASVFVLVGADRAPGGGLSRAPRRTRGLDDAAPALLAEAPMHRAHALEDHLGGGLRLLPRRLRHLFEPNRLAELDGHLGELEPLPVTGTLGAGDRRRQHGSA